MREIRAGEVERFAAMLQSLGTGHGRIVELCGEPGMGKTRLLNRFAARADELGFRVLRGRSSEADRETDFHALAQALDDQVLAEACAELPEAEAELVRRQLLTPPSDRTKDSDEAPTAHSALRSLLARIAGRGTVVLVDDFHIADMRSILLIEFLSRYPVNAPLVIVIAQRSRQTCPTLRNALAHGIESGTCERIALGPLTPAEAARLLDVTRLDSRLTELHRRSGGNPFYLLALAQEEIPGQLRALVDGELAMLSAAEASALAAASVLGNEFPAAALTAVAGLAPDEAEPAITVLQRRDLLRRAEHSGVLKFRHPVLREVVYAGTDPRRRTDVHRQAVAALRAHGTAGGVLATHIERSQPRSEPGDPEMLAEAAYEVMPDRPADAARWLRLAIELGPGPGIGMRRSLARALVADSRLIDARDVLAQCVAAADSPADRAEAVASLALVECFLEHYPEANAMLSAELATGPGPREVVRLIARGVIVGLFDGDLPTPGELARLDTITNGGLPDDEPADRAATAGALALHGLYAANAGDVTEAARLVRLSGTMMETLSDAQLAPYPDYLTVLGWAETIIARLRDAQRHLARQLTICRLQPLGCMVPLVLMGLGIAYHCAARLEDARRTAAEAKEAAKRLNAAHVHDLADMLESAYLAWTNRADGSKVAVASAERAVDSRLPHNWWFSSHALLLLASALNMDGDSERSVAVILTAGGGPNLPLLSPMTRPWCFETLAEVAAANHDSAAHDWARRAVEAADSGKQPNHRGFALLAQAHALGMQDSPGEAAELYRQAARLFATLEMSGAQIRSLNHAARSATAAGRTEDATADFMLARELARRCGATVVYEDADRRRQQLPVRPGNSPRPQVAADLAAMSTLTNREVEVARIAETGKRTKEIAQDLHLSPRTVDIHLTRIYRKLGVSSRSQLVRLLSTLPR